MNVNLGKRLEVLEEKATPPDTEMDLIAKLVKYERIFRDCDIDSSDDPEIAKLDEEYKALMTPEIEEKLRQYESLFEQPVDNVQSQKTEDFETCLDSPQNVDEKLAVEPKDEGSQQDMIGPPEDGWLRRDVFRKELARDSEGRLFWRTIVDLTDVEVPKDPKWDAAYRAALNSC